MKIRRNNNSKPGELNLLQELAGVVKNDNSGSTARIVTIETHINGVASTFFNNLLHVQGHLLDGTGIIAPTIADSTAYPGTLKISFSIPAAKTLFYRIIGTNGAYTDYQHADAAITVDDDEIY